MKIEKFTAERAFMFFFGDYLLAKYTRNAAHVDLVFAFI
jgi:hypothetical protein